MNHITYTNGYPKLPNELSELLENHTNERTPTTLASVEIIAK
jgi:hypothetical protein